ncbi:MAG: aspartate/ornithine carbamoyltransferase family protein [Verrucomicrobiota bacterium]
MHGNKRLIDIEWDELQGLPLSDKSAYFNKDGRPLHVLTAQQFDREMLDNLCDLATNIRHIAKNKPGMRFLSELLDHRRAMLYFSQPSSRTFLSFYAACENLGLKLAEVRDTSTSSEMKGESPEDTVRTFSSYFDLIIMRSPKQGFAERMAWLLSNTDRPVPIINAGSGKDQHPTQALLDIYTLQRSFERIGGIEGKTVVFCGDLARGRTVRSLSYLLTNYPGVRQIFAAPQQLQVGDDILRQLDEHNIEYHTTEDFHAVKADADAIYMTRLQDEWDEKTGTSAEFDQNEYRLGGSDMTMLKQTAVIMHPLPRRQEIAVDVDRDARAMYWRQVRNGMWIRAALIATMFQLEPTVREYYFRNIV